MERNGFRHSPIAIIGQAALYAKARNLREYWNNIMHKVDCITEVPPSRWSIDDYYDPDPRAKDKVYCKRGGFVPDVDFNPMEFGMPPNLLEVTDTAQLLGLLVARDVIADAGYGDKAWDSQRTGVILGVTGGLKMIVPLSARLQYPVWERVLESAGLPEDAIENIVEKIKLAYVDWNENAFPGLLGNVIAGRIANRFDLGGMNSVVDAACASSLSAIKVAMSELSEGRADMMITGGVDSDNSPFTFMCFSKTPAFSQGDFSRPFDEQADGMMVGEGIGMLMLKRLEDAERDGDRIYAVIRGVGSSSDGRYKSIYAPRPEGQALAMNRAYEDAGFDHLSIGLLEAHGTGTKAGDPAEFAGIKQVFGNIDGRGQHIALGSVKSQIGHTKAAAGAAGMIKATMALYHKVLPPTLHVETPNPKMGIEQTPFYINSETRPWLPDIPGEPRRAGVSAFGFGGTNFHVVLEEYTADHDAAYRLNNTAQSVILHAATAAQLLDAAKSVLTTLSGDEAQRAYTELTEASRAPVIPADHARFGFVADNLDEAVDLLHIAIKTLSARADAPTWEHPRGITYRREAMETEGTLVALFPGQGSQYINMGSELVMNFPPMRDMFVEMDKLFYADGLTPLSKIVFPPPAFDDVTAQSNERALRATDYAQAGIGVLSAGFFRILNQAGFEPNFTAGHSFGELSALWAGGVLDDAAFMQLVKARGKAMAPPDDSDFDAGGMLAVKGPLAEIEALMPELEGVSIANQNSNSQVVLAGATAAVQVAADALNAKGYKATVLPVSAAFHTPLVGHASEPFAEAVNAVDFQDAKLPVYSNTTGAPYPEDKTKAKVLLANHILNPVYYKRQIEAIYEAGGRIFVECGPRRITTNLVQEILEGKPHVAVALNSSRQKPDDRQFRDAVVQLRVAGLNLGDIDPWAL